MGLDHLIYMYNYFPLGYDQPLDRGIHYLDEEIGIDWPDEFPRGKNMTVSEKDIHLPKLEDCKDLFDYGENYY